MPSKGVLVYSYVGDIPDCYIVFETPRQEAVVHGPDNNFEFKHLEVESKNIVGAFNFTGTFSWTVHYRRQVIATRHNEINALTGNLEGGNMKSIKVGDSSKSPSD